VLAREHKKSLIDQYGTHPSTSRRTRKTTARAAAFSCWSASGVACSTTSRNTIPSATRPSLRNSASASDHLARGGVKIPTFSRKERERRMGHPREPGLFLKSVSGETVQHRGILHTCVFQALIPRQNQAPIRCPGPFRASAGGCACLSHLKGMNHETRSN